MALKKSQQSLKNWTRQKWRTKSGKKSSETGERYLPEAAIKNMSDEEYAATTRAKREGTKEGKQFVAQPKEIANKTKKYRTMKNGGMMKGKKSQMGMVKSAAPKRKKEMSDKEYFEMQDRKRREGIASMTGQDSVNFLQKLMKGEMEYQEGGEVKKKGKLKKKLKKIGRVLAGKAPEDGSGDYLLGNKKRKARNERQAREMYVRDGGSADGKGFTPSAKKAMERKRAEGVRNLYKLEKEVDNQVGVYKRLTPRQKEINKTRSADMQITPYSSRPSGRGRGARMRTLFTEPGKLVKRQKQFNMGGAILGGGLSAVGKKLLSGDKMDMKELGKAALGGALTGAAAGIGAGGKKVPSAKSGMRFKKLSRKIQKSGKSKSAADAIAAAVGRKKYGAKKFAAMAAAGRKKGK